MIARASNSFESILEKIQECRNVDFRNYKRATLRRRIERRMADRKASSIESYLKLLETDPQEVDRLISGMLIKVTSFFRDSSIWEALADKIAPKLRAARRPGEEIRVWCAGCATGEEAYSVAMLMAELLGQKRGSFGTQHVRIFATDVDEGAVAYGRRGVYTAAQVESVPGERLARWFTSGPEGFTVHKDLRRMLVFGINNLVSDAPISRLDLLLCRNVFIYLDAALQRRVLARFHYALRRDGVLVLGKSELIPFAATIFEPLDLSRRIYRKNDRIEVQRSSQTKLRDLAGDDVARVMTDARDELSQLGQFHRDVLNSFPTPVVGTSLDGVITLWNRAAGRLWGRNESEVMGKKLGVLGLPGLGGELLIEKTNAVRAGKSERELADGAITRPGSPTLAVTVMVSPLRGVGDEVLGLLYHVQDVSAFRNLELELRHVNEERQSAYEELQTTNEELQSSNEELETTNEELQSANEELQTTNEELQSTNEELETTNEELQSTNAELDSTNRELAQRTEELNVLGFYQRTIIRSLSAATIVLDLEERITMWNLAAERLLGLPEREVLGQHLSKVRIPALDRSIIRRVRKSLAQKIPLRQEDVAYQLPGGSKGIGTLIAIPLVEHDSHLGSVVLFEDTTRNHALNAENHRLRQGRGSDGQKRK